MVIAKVAVVVSIPRKCTTVLKLKAMFLQKKLNSKVLMYGIYLGVIILRGIHGVCLQTVSIFAAAHLEHNLVGDIRHVNNKSL